MIWNPIEIRIKIYWDQDLRQPRIGPGFLNEDGNALGSLTDSPHTEPYTTLNREQKQVDILQEACGLTIFVVGIILPYRFKTVLLKCDKTQNL